MFQPSCGDGLQDNMNCLKRKTVCISSKWRQQEHLIQPISFPAWIQKKSHMDIKWWCIRLTESHTKIRSIQVLWLFIRVCELNQGKMVFTFIGMLWFRGPIKANIFHGTISIERKKVLRLFWLTASTSTTLQLIVVLTISTSVRLSKGRSSRTSSTATRLKPTAPMEIQKSRNRSSIFPMRRTVSPLTKRLLADRYWLSIRFPVTLLSTIPPAILVIIKIILELITKRMT